MEYEWTMSQWVCAISAVLINENEMMERPKNMISAREFRLRMMKKCQE